MKDNNKTYSAPELTVVSFSMEQGFAVSGNPMETLMFWDDENDRQVEEYNQKEGWLRGSDGFWE